MEFGRDIVKTQLKYNLSKKVDNNEIGDTRITALTTTSLCCDDCRIERDGECHVVGSSNGLICVSRYSEQFLVVNPSTRQVNQLRDPPKQYHRYSECVSGFGYDSSIDDYKVVIGFKYKDSKKLVFKVLTLKSNVWRSVAVKKKKKTSGYNYLYGNGNLCNGGIHWLYYGNNKQPVIVSFNLSKEVFKEIPLPKLDHQYASWTLGTMKGCLCVFCFPNRHLQEIEIWVMRNDKVQVSWERRLLPPGYDAEKTLMDYFPQKEIFPGYVQIWMLEKGSCAPVLVQSIFRPHDRLGGSRNAYIRLSTNSDCNYNYNHHVFVKSLVSPHGMGHDDGDGYGDAGDGNINDVNPDEDKIVEIAEEYMEHFEHRQRTRKRKVSPV